MLKIGSGTQITEMPAPNSSLRGGLTGDDAISMMRYSQEGERGPASPAA